jgi:hypothetical protein
VQHHEIAPRRASCRRCSRSWSRSAAPLARASDLAVHLLAVEAARSVPHALTGEGCATGAGGYRRYLMRSALLRRMLYEDQTRSLPDSLLERADRLVLVAGIDCARLLDHRSPKAFRPARHAAGARPVDQMIRGAPPSAAAARAAQASEARLPVPVALWLEELRAARGLSAGSDSAMRKIGTRSS